MEGSLGAVRRRRPTFAELFTPKLFTILREGYGLKDFRADAIAGLTVAIVALPLSMAIAIASGVGPERGLYTAIIGGFLVSALGGSRFQIGGPAGAFIVLIAAIVERQGYDGLVLATLLAGAILVAVVTLLVILGMRKWRPTWPDFLIAVTAAAMLAWLFALDAPTIASRFGGLPGTLPAPSLPPFSLTKLRAVVPDAAAIALLGAIESLLSAVVADSMSGRRHRSNCELVAQGFANIGAMMFGGVPVTGTIARTATNVRAGAKSPVSGMLHSGYLLLFMLIAAPLAGYIPLAALGAVLTVVAWNMAERQDFRVLLGTSAGDRLVLLATFFLTVFVDLTIGIGVGVVLGAFVFLYRMAETIEIESNTQLITDDQADDFDDGRNAYDAAQASAGDIVVYRISGAFFFGATAAVSGVLDRIGQQPRIFVLDFSEVPIVDSTAANALAKFAEKLARVGTFVFLTGASASVRRSLLRAGLHKPLVRYAKSADHAVAYGRARLEEARAGG
jgi:SulP family sulfate permease